jgi:hypothetical protein
MAAEFRGWPLMVSFSLGVDQLNAEAASAALLFVTLWDTLVK